MTIKLPKLNEACLNNEPRPVMEYVLITKNHTVATNQHLLVFYNTEELFLGVCSIDAIPDKGILIHSSEWKKLTKPFQFLLLDMENKQFTIVRKNSKVETAKFLLNGGKHTFPQWQRVIPEESKYNTSCNQFGINVTNFYKASEAMGTDRLLIKIWDEKQPVLIIPSEDHVYKCRAILMPDLIHEQANFL